MQNLINLHGGTFELRSELRKGTEAIVVFPKTRLLRSLPRLEPVAHDRQRQPAPPRGLLRRGGGEALRREESTMLR